MKSLTMWQVTVVCPKMVSLLCRLFTHVSFGHVRTAVAGNQKKCLFLETCLVIILLAPVVELSTAVPIVSMSLLMVHITLVPTSYNWQSEKGK